MPHLNDSINVPVSRHLKKALVIASTHCPGKPAHTKFARLLIQSGLREFLSRLESGRPIDDLVNADDSFLTRNIVGV